MHISPIKINKVSITESPILAASYHNETVYLVLDTGATASLISLRQAKALNLRIFPTTHKAIQVDGESDLPIAGEVHTSFKRGSVQLRFNALVVNHLSVDILAGTSFHKENDVYSRMSKGTIHIGDHVVVQSTPPAVLALHRPQAISKHFLVQVKKTITILPGDVVSLPAPKELEPNDFVMIEPNVRQCKPFFEPSIIQLEKGQFEVKNELSDPITIKKNNQAIVMYTTKEVTSKPNKHLPVNVDNYSKASSLDQVLKEIKFDGNLSAQEKSPFEAAIALNLNVF